MIAFLKFLYRGWMAFAHVLGKINTAILLTLFYFLFMGMAKLLTLLLGKDLLDSQWRDRSSYWKDRKDFRADREALLKPF